MAMDSDLDLGSATLGGAFKVRPMTQAFPLTFKDVITLQELVYNLRTWCYQLGPELKVELDRIITEVNAELELQFNNIEGEKAKWELLFNEFMENIIERLEGLNDASMANLVKTPSSLTRVELEKLYATKAVVEAFKLQVNSELTLIEGEVETLDDLVTVGRLSKSVVNDKLDTYRYGTRNVILGLEAGSKNDGENSTTPSNGGYGLVAVGSRAMEKNVRGWNNVAIGLAAMADNLDGYNNVAIGDAAMERNVGGIGATGTSNIAPGSRNVAIGSYALRYNTVGYGNVAVGRNAAHTNVSGAYNTAVGTNAYSGQFSNEVGDVKTGNDNTMIGYNAGFAVNANNNTAVGAHALYSNIGGAENTAIGHSAGFGIEGGFYNVAIGNRAMLSKNSGGSNTAVGVSSLSNASSGNRNVAVGTGSLGMLSSGSSNVAVGYNAGFLLPDDAIGVNSTVSLGAESLARHTGSVALGYQTVTTTVNQVAVGKRHLEMLEHGAVGTPVSGARVYVMVEAGKTNLKIKFPNGEVKTIMGES